jgi:hypothetical protein
MHTDHEPNLSLTQDSPRRQLLLNLFGRADNIPVTTWTPKRATVGEGQHPALIYDLDWQRIAADERKRAVQYIAHRFNVTTEVAGRDIETQFCILDGPDVIVTIPLRLLI